MKKAMFYFLTSSLLSLSSAGAFADQEFKSSLEVLKGYSWSEAGLTVHVYSGGCTEKEDFEVVSSFSLPEYQQGTPTIEIRRIEGDFCRAWLPYGTTITFSLEELGLNEENGYKFRLANPLSITQR